MSNDLIIPEDNSYSLVVPDYLKGVTKGDGGTGLDEEDVIVPRVRLLQGTSKECKGDFDEARPGIYWHTGAQAPIGKSFNFVVIHLSKKVVLWEPTATGTGGAILAYSADGVRWTTGGNRKFTGLKLKDHREPVTWETKEDVQVSGLTRFGSSIPGDEKSKPAATRIFELLAYLPDYEGLSPCRIGLYKSSLNPGKELNTKFMMTRKPMHSMVIKASVQIKSKDGNTWFVPSFNHIGFLDQDKFNMVSGLVDHYKEYKSNIVDEIQQEQGGVDIDDKIPF